MGNGTGICRRCRLPKQVSDKHERGCAWHPSRKVSLEAVMETRTQRAVSATPGDSGGSEEFLQHRDVEDVE